MTDIVERLRAERIVAAIKEMQGKRLEVAFQSDETAHLVTSIIENSGKVARAYLEAGDEIERLRDVLGKTERDLERALAALDHHLKADHK